MILPPDPRIRAVTEAQFWLRVDKTPSGCWEWTGAKRAGGYGELHIWGKSQAAHRVSWELHFGEIPEGLRVCHHCDNRPCVRPDHLFLGTDAHNLADMRRKGRGSPPPRHQGEEIAAGRLTTGQVLEIRRRYYSEDVSGWELARQYGVASNAVWMILRRKTWAHLPFVEGETGEMIQKPKPWLLGSNNPDARLTEEQVHAIRYRYAAEILTIPELSREYGVAYSVIGAILRRQTWAHLPILPGEATCCRTTQETITLRGRRPQPPEANAARAEAMRRHWAALSQEERAARGAPRKTSRGQKREPA